MRRALHLGRLLIEQPRAAVREVRDHPPDAVPLLLAFWGVCAAAVAHAAAGPGFALGSAATLAAALLAAGITLLAGSAALHLSAELLGGNGSILDLLRVLALVFFPNVVLPVFALSGDTIYGLVRLAVLLWQAWIIIAALRENYGLPRSGAVLALLAPAIFVFGLLPLAGLGVLLVALIQGAL